MARVTAEVIFCLLLCLVRTESNQTQLDLLLQENENVSPLIVGGQEAGAHSFPYQAALYIEISNQPNSAFCGGSLISEQVVLTAAHCLEDASGVEVLLGAHDLRQAETTQQRLYSQQLLVHKDYNPSNLANDIALITLPKRVDFTAAVQPVLLAKKSDSSKWFIFVQATVTGWGRTSDASKATSPVLKYIKERIIPGIICSIIYGGQPFKNRICLKGIFGRSPCMGDSGGPLVVKERGGYVQQGITSFVSALGCQSGFPSGFVKVSSYLDWIQANTGILIRS